ncbi:hypothetical protein VNO77_42315 [Canavalia gladiata]|uniref:Pectinesterase inhibitor domain-containing protein n=1 Tax=Canavalia gladiata TaxID=3824 RepID=A0AAN9K324_CANGL
MTTPLIFTLLFFASTFSLLTPIATATTAEDSGDTDFIRTSCNTTLYPDLCFSSLSRYACVVQQSSSHLARAAVAVALTKARRAAAHLSREVSTNSAGDDGSGAFSALRDCFENLGDAVNEIRGSLKQMRRLGPELDSGSVRFGLSNVQTWMSAALTDEETCTEGFEGVAEGTVKTDVCDRVTVVKKFTSNALALVNSFASKEIGMP